MKHNPRITDQEWALIKGALRRVFSRSELRKKCIEKSVVKDYKDPARPKVKTWCQCPICSRYEAKSNMNPDHRDPVVPLDRTLNDLTIDELIDRIWCMEDNLVAICSTCHDDKTRIENRLRREFKKQKKLKGE